MSLHENESMTPVTQLQELRSEAETYETFYQLYGLTELQRRGFSTILSRVLHIDETEDRSTHFVVAKADKPQLPIRQRYDRLGAPSHFVPYDARDIIVASTDGTAITEYDVIDAYGTYRAYLDDHEHKHDPHYETAELSLISSALKLSIKHLVRAEFNVATGNGTVRLGEQSCAWILSATESTNIRNNILAPAVVNHLDQTA